MAKRGRFTVDAPTKREFPRVAQIVGDALAIPREYHKYLAKFLNALGAPRLRVVRSGSQILGGLALTPMGHFFGGRRVGCAGITFLGVSPEWRRKGAASALMASMVPELYISKYPISSLYASTNALYRKSGYEKALVRYVYELDTREINIRDNECEMVFSKKGATKPFRDAQLRQAVRADGNLDRHPTLWNWRHNPNDTTAHRYFVKRGGRVEGYVVYFIKEGEKGKEVWINDMCVLSAAAGRRLLAFFADHGTMIKTISWAGGPNDILLELLGTEKFRIKGLLQAMVRVVSVPRALSERGYPAGLEAQAHFRIDDDLIAPNNGDWVLTVSGGRGKVKKGGKGSIRLDVRALAQLYTGRYSPRELALVDRLAGGEKELDALAPVFAGPMPWLPDTY